MKKLLVVYHSQTGNTGRMAAAVARGAADPGIEGVATRLVRARDAGPPELLWANALVIGTPENFGYMSGAVKDFLDRTFYPCAGRVDSLPFAVFISAGNDGSGALRTLRRIAGGFPFREVQAPVVCAGPLTDEALGRCEELGATMAAGLEMGIF